MIIILAGSMGRLPVGGHAWVDMQYLAGLRALGHEVYYLEECGPESWVYNWETEQLTPDLDYPAGYVQACLDGIGWGDRWIYRAGVAARGLPVEAFREVCARADLLLIRAVPLGCWRPEYAWPRRRAFVDMDPGFTQISLLQGRADLAPTVDRMDVLFTIGQRFGAPDCTAPGDGRRWLPTVAPVALAYWPVATEPATDFTAVLQWQGFREARYAGVTYGQKDREFPRFWDLPRRTAQPFRLALTGGDPTALAARGWQVEPGWIASRTPESYRRFLGASRAEFGVAKQGYVAMRAGWFSDRSVCYLAAGRPALVEDTGLADWLPVGAGIVLFHDMASAIAGVDAINRDYPAHRAAARRIAETVFAADRVLPPLLAAALG
jgi:hypothetical protein